MFGLRQRAAQVEVDARNILATRLLELSPVRTVIRNHILLQQQTDEGRQIIHHLKSGGVNNLFSLFPLALQLTVRQRGQLRPHPQLADHLLGHLLGDARHGR